MTGSVPEWLVGHRAGLTDRPERVWKVIMLEHLNPTPQKPSRVVVLGALGFVGGTCARLLAARGVPVLALDKDDIDLMATGAAEQLQRRLAPDDTVLVVSARAPCKDTGMMVDNIRIMHAVCSALERSSVNHVVYFSSDAVYSDGPVPLTEQSPTEPVSMHGTMHLARELMLKATVKAAPLAVVRSTLIYGEGDPHNGYGPNRFRRLAAAGQEIVLFGEGEERRDHVLVDDVAEIVCRVIEHRSRGTLNIATGEVYSFRDIAERVAATAKPAVAVRGTPRQGEMPHGGYRPFDIAACRRAFPDFRYTSLADGLNRAGGGQGRA
jgi:nucleoside-diphosphate-sugar epimerase